MAIITKKYDDTTITGRLIELITVLPENRQKELLNHLESRITNGKREYDRKPLLAVVDYATQQGTYKDFIKNISEGGMFIETRVPFVPGQQMSLTFSLADLEKHVKVTGEVARKTPQGIGVKFKTIDEEQKERLHSILENI
jgi:uncharacterized protein (TIGR02266 family)